MIKNVRRWRVNHCVDVSLLVKMQEHVWLSKTCRCQKYHVRSVPARQFTVLVDDLWGDYTDLRRVDVVETCLKMGRYDGVERPQMVLRRMWASDAPTENAAVQIKQTQVTVADWSVKLEPLRDTLDGYNLEAIYWWHWTRYYQVPVHRRDAEDNLAVWLLEIQQQENLGLAEANRHASRYLYRLARSLGWRKLTLREQQRLNLSGPWHREELCPLKPNSLHGHPTGCGQYTLDNAKGRTGDHE